MGPQVCLLAVFSISVWGWSIRSAAEGEGGASSVKVSWLPEEPKQGEVLRLWVDAPDGVVVEKAEMLWYAKRCHKGSPRGSAGVPSSPRPRCPS